MKVIVELKTETKTFKYREDAIRWATGSATKVTVSRNGYRLSGFITNKHHDVEQFMIGYSLEKRNKGAFIDSATAIRFGQAKEETGAHWIIRATKIPVDMLKSFEQKTRHFKFKI